MVPVHQHFRLDDRHQTLLLAERCITAEGLCIDFHADLARELIFDQNYARHLAKRAPNSRYSWSRSRSPSSPSVTFSSGHPASGLAPVSTLIPGMMPSRAIASASGTSRLFFCRMVSSYRMTR